MSVKGVPKGAQWRRKFTSIWYSSRALCRGMPIEDFYLPPKSPVPGHVARVCAACPVAGDCLESAMLEEGGHGGRHGIRGGLTPEERRALHRRRAAAARAAELSEEAAA